MTKQLRSLSRKISKLTRRTPEDMIPEDRPKSWWMLVFPGKVLLWIDYMFPNSVTGAIGSARRKDIPGIQIAVSLLSLVGIFALILLSIFSLLMG